MMSHSLDPKVRIVVDLPSDLPPVRIDRNQLELSLLNLGLNARDAMPYGGQIVIKARIADETHLPEQIGAGFLRPSVDCRHGVRHGRRHAEARLRAVLLDQARGQGLWFRAFDGSRAHAPVRRSYADCEPVGRGDHGFALASGGARPALSRRSRLFRAGSSKRARVASCSSMTIRLCSRRPRTCCANLGHEPIETMSAKKALEAVSGRESGRTSQFSTTRCPKCPASPWRNCFTRSVPDCHCFWRLAIRSAKRREEIATARQALHSRGVGSPDWIAGAGQGHDRLRMAAAGPYSDVILRLAKAGS